jgi:hypothetical protein
VRLTINGEPVTYSLENERTLGEVVRGVRSWLADAGFHVTEMKADEHDLVREAPDRWGGIEVSTVAELGVQAAHTGEMRLAHWRTVEKWLAMLEEETRALLARPGSSGPAAAPGTETLSALLSDFPETLVGMKANPFFPPDATALARFEAAFQGQSAPAVAAWPSVRLQEAGSVIAELRGHLSRRVADASAPGEALRGCAARFRESVAKLPDVSILLQTGRDRAAMEIVIAFADIVQSLLGLLPFLPPDAQRGKLISELTPVLRDLVAAFDARDSVLIGDLLEYEITPRIERLAPVLEGAS